MSFIIIVLLYLLPLPCTAITKKDAIKIVNKTICKTSFEANFSYSAYDRKSYSTLYNYNAKILVSDKMYLLETSTHLVICDGTTIYTYLPKENEVHITKASEEINLWNILPVYSKFYTIENIDEIKEGTEKYLLVELLSKDKENDFRKIVLKINYKTHNLIQIHVYESDDTLHIFEICEMKSIEKLPRSHFIFNEKDYPGVEKIDLK